MRTTGKCAVCGQPKSTRRCPNCYRRCCTRCGRPLLVSQSVCFAATENYHIIHCPTEEEKEGEKPRRRVRART